MSGAVRLLPLCVFMECTGITFYLHVLRSMHIPPSQQWRSCVCGAPGRGTTVAECNINYICVKKSQLFIECDFIWCNN